MTHRQTHKICWCGNAELIAFSDAYARCALCGTLVSLQGMSPEQLVVKSDDDDFYGKQYWLGHQSQDLRFPDIHARARNDLTERNLHWLKTLLKYRLPPAKVLELGCSHGSFVALMRHLGYESCGVEMSPWVVEFGRQTFDVPIFVGPVEKLDLAPASLDVIALMDVLEHLPDPLATMAHCLTLLKPDGLLLIQTPQFKEAMDYANLLASQDPFLDQFKADEHLYLFSDRSVKRLFEQLGATHIQFEAAIFDYYDMFLAVSRVAFTPHTPEQIEKSLRLAPAGALVQALLDLRTREQTLIAQLKASEADRLARWQQIQTLTNHVNKLQDSPALAGKKILKTIVVDLTPVLPGGENGGAKIFVLELIRHLAILAPQTQFILLTQAAAHDELAGMDSTNVSRRIMTGVSVARTTRQRLEKLYQGLLPWLPMRIRRLAMGLSCRLNAILKRYGNSSTPLTDLGASLLFCPFTAPIYVEPNIPTVCTIYDLQYKTYPDFFTAEDVVHRDRTFHQACRHATLLTAISDYSRASAIQHGQLDPKRIRTIYLRMAQRIAVPSNQSAAILSRLGLMTGRYLIYPANFWQHKNHEMLFTALGIACQAGLASDIKLVCTGAPGERQDYLAQAAKTMQLGQRIVFPGYVSNEELSILIANARAMIFPSLYEGFGLPVVEAMAAGIPVACSNLTSLPEVAANAAMLFDPRVPTQIADAITRLVEDEALREPLIIAGRQRAVEFADATRMAREYLEVFQAALVQ